jgi:hypothetical protein
MIRLPSLGSVTKHVHPLLTDSIRIALMNSNRRKSRALANERHYSTVLESRFEKDKRIFDERVGQRFDGHNQQLSSTKVSVPLVSELG